jgi:hypothetical protein
MNWKRKYAFGGRGRGVLAKCSLCLPASIEKAMYLTCLKFDYHLILGAMAIILPDIIVPGAELSITKLWAFCSDMYNVAGNKQRRTYSNRERRRENQNGCSLGVKVVQRDREDMSLTTYILWQDLVIGVA